MWQVHQHTLLCPVCHLTFLFLIHLGDCYCKEKLDFFFRGGGRGGLECTPFNLSVRQAPRCSDISLSVCQGRIVSPLRVWLENTRAFNFKSYCSFIGISTSHQFIFYPKKRYFFPATLLFSLTQRRATQLSNLFLSK